jgi:hypothetical protein
MAAAEVEIIYKANADGLNAAVGKITQTNDTLVKEAQDTSKKVADEFKKIGGAAAAAFGSSQVKNALKQLNDESLKLTANLKKLQDEQVDLIASGNRVSKAFKDNAAAQAAIKGQIAEVNAQQKQLNDTYGETENKQKSLTGQLRQLKQELSQLEQAGKENTDEFEKLTLKAAQLEDQIGDTRERVRVLASDTFKFDAAVDAVSTLASGFEVAQGAAALFGDESEALNEVIAKTTAVTAIANGVREIADKLTGQSAGKLAVLSAAQRAYSVVVGTSTGALKAFRVALAATGIGALIVAIGAVIANFDKLKDAFRGTSDTTRALSKSLEESRSAIQAANEEVQKTGNAFELASQGVISQEEALQIFNDTLGDSFGKQTDFNKAQEEYIRKKDAYIEATKARAQAQALLAQSAALAAEAATVTGEEATGFGEKIQTFISDAVAGFNRLIGGAATLTTATFAATTAGIEENARQRVSAEKKAQSEVVAGLATAKLKEAEIIENSAGIASEAEQKLNADREAKRKAASDKAAEAAKKAAEDQRKAREELAAAELEAFTNALDERDKIRAEANEKGQEIEEKFRAAGFKKGTAEAIKAEKEKNAAIEQILIEADKKVKEIDQQAAKDKLEKALEAAKAQADATTQQQIDAANAQLALELAAINETGADKVEIEKRYAEILKGLNKQLNEEIKEENNKRIESEFNTREANLKRLEIIEGSSLDRRIALIELEAERRRKAAKDNIQDEKERAAQIELINAETQAAIRAERQKTDSEAIDGALKVAQEVGDLFKGLADLQKAASEQRITEIQEASQAELDNINKGLESEIDKQRKREALEKRTNAKIAAEKLKQAKLDRGIAIFDVIIKTAQAVNTAVAASPLTFGLPWSAFAAASGAIQLAAIQAQPLPKFKKGGPVGGRSHEAGGTIIEAEKGEFVVNKQSATRHRDALDAMNRSSDAFKKYIEQRYVRPALLDFAAKKDRSVQVNATLNAKGVEKKLDKLTKVVSKQKTTININGTDNRYQWQ